jgi:PAS domain S-box-containing protein
MRFPRTSGVASPNGAVDFINQRWQEFTGLLPEDALGWNWEKAIHPDDRTRSLADWREALETGQPMESEIRVQRADGEHCSFFVRNVPLRDEHGKIVKWYGAAIDIEDRKRAKSRYDAVRLTSRKREADSHRKLVLERTHRRSVLVSGVLWHF